MKWLWELNEDIWVCVHHNRKPVTQYLCAYFSVKIKWCDVDIELFVIIYSVLSETLFYKFQ